VISFVETDRSQQVGKFWIATDPGDKRQGTLGLTRRGDSQLIVSPEFYSGFVRTTAVAPDGSTMGTIESAKDRGPQTLHGHLTLSRPGESAPVSILEARSTNWTGGDQTFRPIWSLVGGHIEPQHPFRGVRLRIPRYGPRPQDSVRLENEGTIRIDEEGGWIEVVDLPPRNYREISRTIIRPICTLLVLATGVRMRPSEIELSPEPETWWPVYTGSLSEDNPAVGNALIPPHDISVAVLAAWLDRVPVLGPLPAGVASLLEVELAIETQVLMMTTLAEGIHRALRPEARRFELERGKTIREVATEAVRKIDPEAAGTVQSLLKYVDEMGYGARLKELASRAEELVPGITGNPRLWKKLVYETRNKFAHQHSVEWMEEAGVDRVLTVAFSLSWVLRLLLLDQAGFVPGLIADRFRNSQSYGFFLTDAAEWRPDIYSSASDDA